ncbi:penicillin-binding transpeptidase domain-containing protein [Gracilibacillus alcaliphilus]|uniref:penicillin-binding transpeptidase domain-containing protein n=1 Tax=Gracilibacillus alcaliphilus TaxID=1401441 RepID=UPI00195856DA|nr:penicillin-binding transpeptidase domain-containing protein [Gracilibacillus alcaliphilus]MBM7679521.1 penicillin-binding protein [Gracilibacillus alcaliphilus]
MKRYLPIMMLLFIFIIGCSNDEMVKPEERLQDYVEYWNQENFAEMYKLAADEVEQEEFERFEKIYQDTNVSDLEVTFEANINEEERNLEDINAQSFPVQVSLETLAGPVSFDTEIEMIKTVDEEDVVDWQVNWHPGLIFPELADGGSVGIHYVTATRGEIFDRNQEGLAVNQDVYEVGVQPGLFQDEEAEKEQISEAFDITVEAIDRALSADWVNPELFVPLKTVPALEEDMTAALDSIEALSTQTTTGRTYPFGEAVAHLIGYIAPVTAEKLEELDSADYSANDMIGYRGLEELFETELRGKNGVRIVVNKDEAEAVIIAEQEVEDGQDIYLTIDSERQQQIFNELDGDAGTAAAIDGTTGETLALVSSPSFDPHTFVYGLSDDEWGQLQDDEQNPLLNRFAAKYAPGSVFKPITSAIGLANGSIDPNEGLTINGLTWQKNNWGNYSVRRVSESNGPVDLRDALVRSDNIYFARQALEIGEADFINGLHAFGIGEDLPYTYPIQSSTISADGSLENEVLLADTSYGQGQLEMSALHLAVSYSIFTNNGSIIQPVLLTDEEQGVNWKDDVLSEDNVSLISEALRAVVTEGTGQAANADGTAVAGKTGTAELKQSLDEEGGAENGWFVGYPEDGNLIIAMMVEHVEQQNNGSGYVAEKVGKLLSE